MTTSPKKRVPKESPLPWKVRVSSTDKTARHIEAADGWIVAMSMLPGDARLIVKAVSSIPTPRSSDEKRRLEKLRDAVVKAAMFWYRTYFSSGIGVQVFDQKKAEIAENRLGRAAHRLELFNRSKKGKRNA